MGRKRRWLETFLRNPEEFVEHHPRRCTQSFMREFAEWADFEIAGKATSRPWIAVAGLLLAQHTPGTCSSSRAYGLSGTTKKMQGLLAEADKELAAALDSAADCLHCQANVLRRRVFLRHDQKRLRDAVADAELCCRIYRDKLNHSIGLGTALISLGQAIAPIEGYAAAAQRFSEAFKLTGPPERPEWGNVVCPSMPSDKIRTGYHRIAFANLTIALARTGDPENLRQAETMFPEVRAAYTPHRWKMSLELAKLNWLDGQIAWRLHHDRRRAERLHRRAYRGILKHGAPLDVAYVYADLAELLEQGAEGELISDLYTPPDPDQRAAMELQLQAMPAKLRKLVTAVRDAAFVPGFELGRCIRALRRMTIELGALPPLWCLDPT